MLDAWLVRHVPHLVQLAAIPFDRVTHERYFATIGWTVIRESWYPETCVEIRFDDVGRRLVAMYDESETSLGTGLYALVGSPDTDDIAIASRTAFDEAFDATLATMMFLLRNTPAKGTYHSQSDNQTYNYAYWGFPQAFVILVQHFEGDANYGHEASLDLRMVPRLGTDQLVFPLRTNILF
jgi:hypothetical protein